MNKKYSVAIIGAGNIAGGFDEKSSNSEAVYSHAGAYAKHGGFELKSVFDANKTRARDFADIWSVDYVAESELEIIDSHYDVISICSPDKFHFETLKNILINNSCKIVFVEKPLGLSMDEITEILALSEQSSVKVVVNFQRHFDDTYEKLNLKTNKILAVNCYYIKGLKHIGITMIDTLVLLFGLPTSVLGYNKVFNEQIQDYSYEFILFYNEFNITVKTIDDGESYKYHIFDIDILTDTGRFTITDNGNTLVTKKISNYDYSEVKVLENNGKSESTGYRQSMIESVKYIYNLVEEDTKQHNINTIASSFNNHLIVEKIIESNQKKQILKLEETQWKK